MKFRTRFVMAALALDVALVGGGRASAQDFCDDFSNRDIIDGVPVSWGPECFWSNGIYDASSGDLVVGSRRTKSDATLPVGDVFFTGDVSVRTRLSIAAGSTLPVMVRAGPDRLPLTRGLLDSVHSRIDGSHLSGAGRLWRASVLPG